MVGLLRYALCLALLSVAMLACGPPGDGPGELANTPEELDAQECGVCGMLVRDQSAPRAQVVHRDGTRPFLCSLGDLLVYLTAASSHGRVEAVFVEVMAPSEDPAHTHTGAHEWIPAEDAIFLVGVDREKIMGTPVLAFRTAQEAQQVLERHPGARALEFRSLRNWWAERPLED